MLAELQCMEIQVVIVGGWSSPLFRRPLTLALRHHPEWLSKSFTVAAPRADELCM